MAKLEDRLAALATLSPAQSREEWQATFGETPPALPPSLLRRALAHHVQEQACGALPLTAQRMLDTISRNPAAKKAEPPIQLKPGTRLLREWNGALHAVLVTDDGLMFDGRHFASLSHVAREITGAHRSGPRFFGLKRRPPPPSRKGATHG